MISRRLYDEISKNLSFHNIFYDGKSHYYIDSSVGNSYFLNILKIDTKKQEYFEVTEHGIFPIAPYIYHK